MSSPITSPDDVALDRLCQELRSRADALDSAGAWPAEQLRLCAEYGVFRWFVREEYGGLGLSDVDLLRCYLKLSASCLATTFVLTQPAGVCRRVQDGSNEWLKARLLPDLAEGETFATVGISHLTTSRRHLASPVMTACPEGDGFLLDGLCPWVTGGIHAQHILTGATLADGRQVLLVLPTDLPGVVAEEPARMVGLTSTHTGAMRCHAVHLERQWLLAGPVENVMSRQRGAQTGSLQTSALALGLAESALGFLEHEAQRRSELAAAAALLRQERAAAEADLLTLAAGGDVCTNEELRARANSIALRSAQAALAAAKGTGFVIGHPAGRWCREALFFLVWSCPQPVVQAALCELAGIG